MGLASPMCMCLQGDGEGQHEPQNRERRSHLFLGVHDGTRWIGFRHGMVRGPESALRRDVAWDDRR